MATTQQFDEQVKHAMPNQRISILDPLRGIAALAVTWFHFTHGGHWLENAKGIGPWLELSGDYGWAGVDIFFVISGFVLPFALSAGGYRIRHFGTFLWKRLIRLEPPYLVSIAIVLVLSFLGPMAPGFRGKPFEFELPRLLSHLGYLSSFFDYTWYNVVYWTLAIELQFYLTIALLFPLFVHRRSVFRTLAVSAMLLISTLSDRHDLLPTYLPLFALGIITFQYYKNLLTGREWLLLTVVAVCFAFFTTGLAAGLAGLAATMAIVSGKLFLAEPLVKNPIWRFLTWLGTLSYSLYLLHVPIGGRVVNIGIRFSEGSGGQMLTLVIALAVSIFSAWILHYFIEKPSQRWSASIKFKKNSIPESPIHPAGQIRADS